MSINEVYNYDALPDPSTVSGMIVKTLNATENHYKGLYRSTGVEWIPAIGQTDELRSLVYLVQKLLDEHGHPMSAITGLVTALATKANTSHTHAISDVTNLQTSLNGKANTTHSHAISDITNLQTALNAKNPLIVAGVHINDSATNAATNAQTNAPTNLNVLTTLLGTLTGEVNATNSKQNDLAAKYNDLATKYNNMATNHNLLLDRLEAAGILLAT